MILVIVESPAKAKKIAAILGGRYRVRASLGHVRDLPARKEEVPARYAGERWARLGVDVEGHFKPLYVVPRGKAAIVKELRATARGAERVLLATDPDREGEAIAWHLAQLLALPDPQRMTFHEITPTAIQQAAAHPRPLDLRLVAAAETRRVLDRLSGYGASPLLWDAVGPGLSAGRVQSAALALLATREVERLAFTPAPYWRVTALVEPGFTATVTDVDGRALATPRDFGPDGLIKGDALLMTPEQAAKLAAFLKARPIRITEVQSAPYRRPPPAPFTTSTLQQAASSRLKMNPQRTMEEAQRLYEAGLITYMRTDSPALSDEATHAAREAARTAHGEGSVPLEPRQYAARGSAQEAHEAIRPTGRTFTAPAAAGLDGQALALYDLIYRRTIASQMTDLTGTTTSVTLASGRVTLSASGRVIHEQGFTRAYQDDDPEPDAQALPALHAGETRAVRDASAQSRSTPAPKRYSEAALVRALERAGIGRPSTYASTLSTLQARAYTSVRAGQLHVTALGLLVSAYLTHSAPELVDAQYTARLEADLDRIASGDSTRLACLDRSWTRGLALTFARAARTPPAVTLPKLPGVTLSVQAGQPSVTDGTRHAILPPELLPEDLTPEVTHALLSGLPLTDRRKDKKRTPRGQDAKGRSTTRKNGGSSRRTRS